MTRLRTRATSRAPRWAVCGALALVSCASQPNDGEQPPRTALEAAESVVERPLSPGEDNGLEVVTWSIANREVAIRRALGRHAMKGVRLGTTAAQLERLGLRAVVVREDQLAALLADVGGTSTSVATWHGQVTAWREIARTSLEQGHVTMVDGRAEVLGSGWLRLMTRAWTVELEDGAVLSVQVAPQWIADAGDLSGLTNRDSLRGRVFAEAAIATELPPDTALLLLASPAKAEEEEDPEGPVAAAIASGRQGPPGDLPETPGEVLLTDRAAMPARRLVLVLRARLPDILLPERPAVPAAAAAATERASLGSS